jgi:protein-S-isoprenylcysteine O-methyltransferase Ste14
VSRRTIQRWFKSTSNRIFIVFPLVVVAVEALWQGGWPAIQWLAMPLLPWGYFQYRLAGNYRTRLGGGGPGIEVPPERMVTTGIYRFTRNPMYLGHLIFLLGVALVFRSWVGLILLLAHLPWYQQRVSRDEARMVELFGDRYREYTTRVRRWVPWVV